MSRATSVVAALVGALIVSCASAKLEKLERPKRIPHATQTVSASNAAAPVLVPRPPLELTTPTPDFHDDLRWPLSSMSHPALEPRFEIASQFAEVDVGWMELCSRGVQNSSGRNKEMLAYLRGWCAAVKGDADTACANLTPLLGSTTSGMRVAVRTDLANILANGHSDNAAHLIKVHNIRDVNVLDLLSANYVEVGTTSEAFAFNREAIDSDDYATAATKCRRLTKAIILSGDKQSALLFQVEELATKSKLPEPTCVALYNKLDCWRDKSQCRAFYVDEGFDTALVNLTDAYYGWHQGRTQGHWLDVVDKALSASPLPGSTQLALAALENAVRTDPMCDKTMKDWIQQRTNAFRGLLDKHEQVRLDMVIASCK